ncbi:MAG: bile acid:sodium symporter family protein [Pirellulales bacterium]|nr:bile acid:sodium symporter family protein [Pirellulales bacterium]
MFQKLLLVWLVALSALAYVWPSWFSALPDPFLAGKQGLDVLLAVTMFLIGWLLPRDEFTQVIARWPLVVFGALVQYGAMPLGAVLMAALCGLEGELRAGVILAGCVPGAMASNVLTLLARGNVSYSISLTTASTLVSPLTVPALLALCLGESVAIDAWATFIKLSWTVVGPVLVGHQLARLRPAWQQASGRAAEIGASVTILWVIAIVVGANRDRLHHFEPRLWTALLGTNLLGYLAGWYAGRAVGMTTATCRALTLEIGMQNAGLGTMLAMTVLHSETAAVGCALYAFGCMFTGTLLARIWQRIPLAPAPAV